MFFIYVVCFILILLLDFQPANLFSDGENSDDEPVSSPISVGSELPAVTSSGLFSSRNANDLFQVSNEGIVSLDLASLSGMKSDAAHTMVDQISMDSILNMGDFKMADDDFPILELGENAPQLFENGTLLKKNTTVIRTQKPKNLILLLEHFY